MKHLFLLILILFFSSCKTITTEAQTPLYVDSVSLSNFRVSIKDGDTWAYKHYSRDIYNKNLVEISAYSLWKVSGDTITNNDTGLILEGVTYNGIDTIVYKDIVFQSDTGLCVFNIDTSYFTYISPARSFTSNKFTYFHDLLITPQSNMRDVNPKLISTLKYPLTKGCIWYNDQPFNYDEYRECLGYEVINNEEGSIKAVKIEQKVHIQPSEEYSYFKWYSKNGLEKLYLNLPINIVDSDGVIVSTSVEQWFYRISPDSINLNDLND